MPYSPSAIGRIHRDNYSEIRRYLYFRNGYHIDLKLCAHSKGYTPISRIGLAQYGVEIDDPNITVEEYITLEEEKARRRGKVYKWETATYVLNDALTSEIALSCEPTVSPLNDNKIDFRISFDESDDEDYTVIFDKNSLSYKIISGNNLKTDSENDNEKVNIPLFPSPEPTVSYFDDLDFFKDFENEFTAIIYNDVLTSKLDFFTNLL
ncbi:hypothetical protein Tco_0299258 [Tanacetum coccineum]